MKILKKYNLNDKRDVMLEEDNLTTDLIKIIDDINNKKIKEK